MAQTSINKRPTAETATRSRVTLASQADDIGKQANKILELEAKVTELRELKKAQDIKEKTFTVSRDKLSHDMKPIKGIFRFIEVPGGELKFTYGKYKNKMKTYTLKDGESYTLPRCVAQHLSEAGSYPVHEYQTDVNGVPIIRIGRKKRRYTFDSPESFNDTDSKIVTAERIIYK